MWNNYVLLVLVLATTLYGGDGCQMDGVTNWLIPVTQNVYDTQRGSFFNGTTTDITGISSVNYGEGLNSGPYVTVSLTNAEFDIATNDAFINYEENETVGSMSFTVTFSCSGGSTRPLVFVINIIDTNNNAPQFLPSDNYEFVIAPPLPPGFQITGCVNDITVRDIDLTTQRIDFTIEDNPYFEIAYDAAASTVPKEFKAVLRTTTLIRTLPEVIQLRISATDVDLTGDPPITTVATIRVEGNTDFQLPEEPIFSEPFYLASYTEDNQVNLEEPISLRQGFHEDVGFTLDGDYANNFNLVTDGNRITLTVRTPLSSETFRTGQIFLVVKAERDYTSGATTTVIVQLPEDSQAGSDVSFNKILYEGLVQAGTVQHESITITGFNGTSVDLIGEFSALFTAAHLDGVVTVRGVSTVSLATDVAFVSLELRAGGAGAVLILDIIPEAAPDLPSVTFSSQSYIIRVDITQSGRVGQVSASADNGEALTYTLLVDNVHLLQRISIDNEGGLQLSAPVNSGVYSLHVIATTVFTQISANAPIHLTVDAITVCADDIVIPPLIILDRDEELEHRNLVVINETEHSGCRYTLNNRWPIDQTWLYVDDTGLHTRLIDREDESIAFMALSQVQVELTLECDSDNSIVRNKRSIDDIETRLGPYDYGDNKWALTDSILYNPRRSLVNLIVNDINDNAPVFVGKEQEPLLFGYPIPDLEERVLPRALAELKATDADIGVNAELIYWSSEEVLAVSALTGFVHVRDNTLQNDTILTVQATDFRGQGNTGNISIQVKLIDTSHIAVITVSDAFLDDETTIITQLNTALGYEVRVLRSTVISDREDATRKKRDVTNNGAVLQLYVYGLMEREPVNVDRLTGDINSNLITTVNIASMVSLEDHLEGLEICDVPGRDTGLFVATIVLSVLLFILIVAIAVWFILRWRKKENYDQFSDANSLASRNESLPQIPKPENQPKPRLNIEELKRSERRLQEMLDAPIEDVLVQPTSSKEENAPVESKVNIPAPQPQAPIVIQSIDKLNDVDESDDDEFGERVKNRRKSVVTFNENVEKIIHVEESPDDSSEYEVYKF